jgi:hypothetical protein
VFFAGAVDGNSTVRSDGIHELLALRNEGYVIDVPQQRLPMEEFHRRVAQAWLAWSPGGLGWDCSRHYEIAWLGTAPLMNYPTIVRDRPLRDGEHCILHGTEPGELAQAVRAALSDRPRLAHRGRRGAPRPGPPHGAGARSTRRACRPGARARRPVGSGVPRNRSGLMLPRSPGPGHPVDSPRPPGLPYHHRTRCPERPADAP